MPSLKVRRGEIIAYVNDVTLHIRRHVREQAEADILTAKETFRTNQMIDISLCIRQDWIEPGKRAGPNHGLGVIALGSRMSFAIHIGLSQLRAVTVGRFRRGSHDRFDGAQRGQGNIAFPRQCASSVGEIHPAKRVFREPARQRQRPPGVPLVYRALKQSLNDIVNLQGKLTSSSLPIFAWGAFEVQSLVWFIHILVWKRGAARAAPGNCMGVRSDFPKKIKPSEPDFRVLRSRLGTSDRKARQW